LKFSDIVMAVASLAVIMVLIGFPLEIALASALGLYWGQNVGVAISMLLSPLVVGYIFAGKIWEESRVVTIAKITVLAAALVMLFVMHVPALADWNPMVREAYEEANPGKTLSTSEWVSWELIVLYGELFLNAVMVLVLGFVGLYVGSMLRRPVKSGK